MGVTAPAPKQRAPRRHAAVMASSASSDGQLKFDGREFRLRLDALALTRSPRTLEVAPSELTVARVRAEGLPAPRVVRRQGDDSDARLGASASALGMRLPPRGTRPRDVARLVCAAGACVVPALDTATQEQCFVTLAEWVAYWEARPRRRVLNVISLEISGTPLGALVEAPAFVRDSALVRARFGRHDAGAVVVTPLLLAVPLVRFSGGCSVDDTTTARR